MKQDQYIDGHPPVLVYYVSFDHGADASLQYQNSYGLEKVVGSQGWKKHS